MEAEATSTVSSAIALQLARINARGRAQLRFNIYLPGTKYEIVCSDGG